MTQKKQLIYTAQGEHQMRELAEEVHRRLEDRLREMKSVPGDIQIEVTGSDVEELRRDVLRALVYRSHDRRLLMQRILTVYALFGVCLAGAGILYPYAQRVIESPIQIGLVVSGLAVGAVSYFAQAWFSNQRREEVRTQVRTEALIEMMQMLEKSRIVDTGTLFDLKASADRARKSEERPSGTTVGGS